MEHSYQQLPSDVRKWNCTKIFLLLINILFLAISLTAIIIGVLGHLYLFFSASFLLSFGFSYSQYSYYLYTYGLILMPIACIGIAVTFRLSYKLTKCYTNLLSTLTVIEIVGVIILAAMYPFVERHIFGILQDTIDECDVTSVAHTAITHVQMIFQCCGLNHPDTITNDTRIQTSCYSRDKYTVYDSYCNPDRFYEINCFTQIYHDCLKTLFTILVYAAATIITQAITIYFAVLHGLHILRERNNAIELATTADDVVMSRYNRKYDFAYE